MKFVRSKSVRRLLILNDLKNQKVFEFRARAYNLLCSERAHLIKIRVVIDGKFLPSIRSMKFVGHSYDYDSPLTELRCLLRIVRNLLTLNDQFAYDYISYLKGYLPSTFFDERFTNETLAEFIEALTYYSLMIRQANAVRLGILSMPPFSDEGSHDRESIIHSLAREFSFLSNSPARFAVSTFVIRPDILTHRFETESFEDFRKFVRICVSSNHPVLEVMTK